MDRQLRSEWPTLMNQVAAQLNPLHDEIFARFPMRYISTADSKSLS
jgi:hypothetical protein